MNKLLKLILVGVGFVVVLVAIAAVVLPMVIDPNDYKQEIRTAVMEKTGRELSIGGEIKWTVFPSIGLGLSDLQLSNRDGFGDRPMFDIGSADASVKLMPLFSRRIEIGKISLADVSAHLVRKANGKSNWEDLIASESTSTSSSGDSGVASLVVSGIEISNANVTWDDAGDITELKEFGLQASNIELGQPFKLEGGFSINLVQSQLTGTSRFAGLVQSQADGEVYGIEGFEFSFEGEQGLEGQKTPLDLSVRANAHVDLSKDHARLSDFVFQFHELKIDGDLEVTALSKDPNVEGQLKLAEFSPKSFMNSLGMEVPQTADANALTSMQADMNFSGTSNGANLRKLNLVFDKSIFKGNLKVNNFDRPKLSFDFEIDSLNLDEYSEIPAKQVEPNTAGDSAIDSTGSDLTVDTFRGFTGGGDFRIKKLLVAGLTATDVSMKMSSNGNGVRFFPISAAFYGGKHSGDIRIDASGKRPILVTSQEMKDIQAESLLQDMTGTARLQGTGNVSLDIRTDLSNEQASRQSLAGNMSINFLDGAILGIDVAETIRVAKATLGKSTDSEANAEQDPKTDFSELSMSGVFRQGILSSDDLKMLSPLLRVSGKGSVNLVDETIDYLVKPTLVGSLEGQGGQGLEELSGVPIPVRLSGNLYEPDIKVDIMAAITESQKQVINQKKDELISDLLSGKDDSKADDDGSDENDKEDAVKSLIGGLLGGSKDKDKKKDQDEEKDDGGK